MTTTERIRSRRMVLGLLTAGLWWIAGLGAPAAFGVAPGAAQAGASWGAAVEQPPDDSDDTGDEPDDEEDEETPDDEPDETEEGDEREPEPEPGNVPVIAWIGAAVLVLAAIAWAVNVARD